MGLIGNFLTAIGRPDPVVTAAVEEQQSPGKAFSVAVDSGVLYGTPTLDDYIFHTGRITRDEALRVPGAKRARDLICASIGQWTLTVKDPGGKPDTTFTPNLFTEPEAGVPASVTWTHVVEDMLLFERSWFNTLILGWHRRPIQGRRLMPETVTVQPKYEYYEHGTAKVWPEIPGLIRFDSPNPGILNGSPAVRACIALERIAMNHLNGVPPIDFFTPRANATTDPFEDDDEAKQFLSDWAQSRRERSTGFVPYDLEHHVVGWDPEKLQLAEARNFAILEIARLTGIDAEELSVSVTSRDYANMQDRRRSRIEDVLGPYMKAIELRLSMDDVTPHGYTVEFDTSGYLRLDDLAAAKSDEVLVRAKILRPNEARAKRGLEPIEGGDAWPATPPPLALPAAQETANA